MQVCDGDIVEHDIEVLASVSQAISDLLRDLLSLSEELSSVVSGDDGFEHLIDNRGQNATVIVHAQESVQLMQILGVRTEQHSQRDVNHLQIFGSSAALNLLGVRAHIIDDLTLEVGHLEVPSFAHDVVLHSAELVELKGTMTRLDIENS